MTLNNQVSELVINKDKDWLHSLHQELNEVLEFTKRTVWITVVQRDLNNWRIQQIEANIKLVSNSITLI